MKKCSKCKESKGLDQFHRMTASPDGFCRICKQCGNIQSRDNRRKNVVKNRLKSREWYWKNVERAREACRKWRNNNPLKRRESWNASYRKNKEKYDAASKKWQCANKERYMAARKKWVENNKDLIKNYTKKSRLKHAEQRKEYNRKYFEKYPERRRAANKRWREKHLKFELERQAKWREENRDKSRAASRSWGKNNPINLRISKGKRRAQIMSSSDGTVTKDFIVKLMNYQNGSCANPACKKDLILNGYHIDHIKPLSKGGAHSALNIQLLCAHCNHSKTCKEIRYEIQPVLL